MIGRRSLSLVRWHNARENEYGCPGMEELERYGQEYKQRLDDGLVCFIKALQYQTSTKSENLEKYLKIWLLTLEVSSPGAERLLRVPDNLQRFEDIPMSVCYAEQVDAKCREKDGVFNLESIEAESESCVWKLANVKEDRDPNNSKGRPFTRKQRDWRLKLPFSGHKGVLLYLEC